jgi:hypothetical protein
MVKVSQVYMLAGVAVIAAGLYVYTQGVKNVAHDIGGAAIDLVDGVVSGAVEGIGEKIGIPQTNLTKCEQAKAQGNTWAASFDCPAADFIGYLWN